MKKYKVVILHMTDDPEDGFDTKEEAVRYGLLKVGKGKVVILLEQAINGSYEVLAEIC